MRAKTTIVWLALLLAGNICVAEETDPSAIFKKVIAAYDALDTYSAEGTIVADLDTGIATTKLETSFTIKLKKPNLYLISWEQKNPLIPFTQAGAVWNDGSQPFLYMFTGNSKAYSKIKGDETALGGATGISGGAAHTVPSLFLSVFKQQGSPFARLIESKLEESAQVEMDDCYVISGRSASSKKETYWISKKTFLIRRYVRSLEPPEGGIKMPKMNDEQLETSIKAMGQEPTEERKLAMKKMMEHAEGMMKQMNVKGTSTETHSNITAPKLSAEDFVFKVPADAVLKESLLGGMLDRSASK
jgi:outer membrane lipoprotein-sorting protein